MQLIREITCQGLGDWELIPFYSMAADPGALRALRASRVPRVQGSYPSCNIPASLVMPQCQYFALLMVSGGLITLVSANGQFCLKAVLKMPY